MKTTSQIAKAIDLKRVKSIIEDEPRNRVKRALRVRFADYG
jgi:hypothetical protein